MHDYNTRGASSAHTQNKLSPEQEKEFLSLFSKLDSPTQRTLIAIMRASLSGDADLMRVHQQQLPENSRHCFDNLIKRTEAKREASHV